MSAEVVVDEIPLARLDHSQFSPGDFLALSVAKRTTAPIERLWPAYNYSAPLVDIRKFAVSFGHAVSSASILSLLLHASVTSSRRPPADYDHT
ncbi:hypothetical protein PTE31013_03864 [Pandoraea terrigena]|uniref:Uncharacterized protein n=1 Tax=Pandoraea terrigena TaxID=2508292 RepID=A0A5E4XEU1_9BURK|nr:hypothetical protein PTE31013_03864 [Pandoraea terrigena]